MTGPAWVPRHGSNDADDLPAPQVATVPVSNNWIKSPAEEGDTPRGMWPPSTVVKEDRGKATVMWVFLLAAFVAYVVYISVNAVEMRKNPPVQILRKNEPFELPDVVICPSAGDGCNGSDGSDCLPMSWFLSSVEGLADCSNYFATPPPTPSPTLPPTPAPTSKDSSYYDSSSFSDDSSSFSESASSSEPATLATRAPTPAPQVQVAIRYNVETTAYDWCRKIPLSECAVDYAGVDSGYVRALQASFYVLWDDMVSTEAPTLSTRRLVNMFFVGEDEEVTDSVVAVRLPYDRVNINGTDPFTFSSNDVILSMSQYVHLGSDGKSKLVERTYAQATTTGQHTLVLESFEGKEYEGALLYVTLSVNNFAYQSIEEIDPVDWWALLGSAGGVWEIICVVFGACFVAHQAIGPDKRWGWATLGGEGGGRCNCCMPKSKRYM